MYKILNRFNFGPSFQNWVKICYTNIINNGFTSGWFSLSCGIRQGCPLSTVLFVICIELLGQLIGNNEEIVGLKFGTVTYKISMFADGATCILKDVASVEKVFAQT